ncbi:unnamed protein product [Boreogadus saida]
MTHISRGASTPKHLSLGKKTLKTVRMDTQSRANDSDIALFIGVDNAPASPLPCSLRAPSRCDSPPDNVEEHGGSIWGQGWRQ